MENSDKNVCLNDGFQAQFSTKESEGELPLHAETGIDKTENIMSSDHTTCIDEELNYLGKKLEAMYQTIEKTKKETIEEENRCEICFKAFSSKGNLTKHLRVHTGERPYKCDECEKAFKTKDNLNDHLTTHKNERPYICDTCEMTFKLKNHLRRHLLTHTTERPHACNECSKTYARGDKLKQHLRTHKV